MNSLSISINEFLQLTSTDFTGRLADTHHTSHSSLASVQTSAWKKEYEDLREQLEGIDGWITFEYGIPNLNKVVDVILLTAGKIFVIEFKTGSKTHPKDAIKQVEGYAYRLKYYHSGSNDKWVIPILVATDGTCQHEITAEDIKRLNEWQDIQIDEELLLNNILTSYQTYWDNVIKSYKRPSARKNRLQYLVNNTDDILKLPSVQKYPAFTVKVKTLQNHYRHLISGE